MFTFISNLFRKSGQEQTPAAIRSGSHFMGEAPPIVPTVETAQLSLAAILAKFPDDLKSRIQQMPEPSATVALPVPTILKQLPSCSVKMSLASLYRQAPAGVFKPGPPEEKRMVEVPLAEVFKKVRPELLKRRQDQRPCRMPADGFELFGDKANPHAVALTLPDAVQSPPVAKIPVFECEPEAAPETPEPAHEAPSLSLAAPAELAASVAPSPSLKLPVATPKPAPVSKPARQAPVVTATVATPKVEGPPLVLPIGELAAKWPELIQAEVGAMNGATVSLPAGEVTAGLAKGRVVFAWGVLREWITPVPPGASGADADTELALPLRVVAPAFLKHTKNGGDAKKRVAIDDEIPTLFHGAEGAPAAPAQTLAPPPDEVPESSAPVPVETPAAPVIAPPAPAPEPIPAAPAPTVHGIGELFGQPGKANWSPSEIVENVAKLPGVSGAVVAMQEGLLVAQHLPEHLNGEAFAAFLPQIFARLNQYAGEMKLGEVDELAISASGADCYVFRLGDVLFAAVGKAGEGLPVEALRLCANQLKK